MLPRLNCRFLYPSIRIYLPSGQVVLVMFYFPLLKVFILHNFSILDMFFRVKLNNPSRKGPVSDPIKFSACVRGIETRPEPLRGFVPLEPQCTDIAVAHNSLSKDVDAVILDTSAGFAYLRECNSYHSAPTAHNQVFHSESTCSHDTSRGRRIFEERSDCVR